MKRCSPAALVGIDVELPTDPGVANEGNPPRVGCNHLVCDDCGAEVRHADRRSITSHYPPSRTLIESLYASSDPASSPYLDAAPVHRLSRAYFCRCHWASVDLGGTRSLGDIDAPWGCAGHEPRVVEASDLRVAEARKATDAPVQPAGPADRGAKIRIVYARGVNPEFGTASELRDSLLASYPDADFFRAPVVDRGGDHVAPAWGWVIELIRMRSDWWPAIGIALQHAVTDGGELARAAFADLLAGYRDSLVLRPWTAELAATMPDVRARGTGTGWGAPDLRLETIVRDQTAYVAHLKATSAEVALLGYGERGAFIEAPLTDEVDLRALLEQTARAGQFPDGGDGPWSWLGFELRTRPDWLRAAFSRVVSTLDHTNEPQVFAFLDWASEEQDLWRFEPTLESWSTNALAWSKTAANKKPMGWSRTIRSSHWPEVKTLGDVARQALWRARKQRETPPVVDLPLLFSPTIS
jgi:hypothetical protein